MPDEILEHIDYYTGQEMGRIYRIAPAGFEPGASVNLGEKSISDLVALLDHEDGWWRATAHRLLFERQAIEATAALRSSVRRSLSPRGRLHALWSLEGLDQLDEATLLAALEDAHPAVRQNAVRLAESRLAGSTALPARVASLAADEDPGVRFQVALAVPGADRGDGPAILAGILRRDPGDEWIRAAVFSGARENSLALLELLLQDSSFLADPDSPGAVRQLAANVASRKSPEAIRDVLAATSKLTESNGQWIRMAAVSGVANGLERAGSSLPAMRTSHENRALGAAIAEVLAEAPTVAVDKDSGNLPERTEAIRLLSWAPREAALSALDGLLSPDEPAEIQLAAVRSLSAYGGQEVGQILIRHWRMYSPAVRREAVEVLFGRVERLKPFLDSLENGDVRVAHLDTARRSALLDHPQDKIRERARANPCPVPRCPAPRN